MLSEVCIHFLKQICVHLCVCVHGHLQRPEEGVGSLEQVLVSCLVWVLGTNLGIQQEQQALSTGEQFLQPIFPFERSHLGLNGMVFCFSNTVFGLLCRRF